MSSKAELYFEKKYKDATAANRSRMASLFYGKEPRYIRCYDNGGKTADRYTVCYTGRYKKESRQFEYVGMSAFPFHPLGIGQHGSTENQSCDRPTSSHLGKKINYSKLPEDCQKLVMQDYFEIWELEEK
jgi:hypothetical protein